MSLPRIGYYVQIAFRRLQLKKSAVRVNVNNERFICLHSSAQINNREFDVSDAYSNTAKERKNAEEILENSVTDIPEQHDKRSKWSSPAYPECERAVRDQARKRLQNDLDPQDTTIILFPGQGSQYTGMGKNLNHSPEAKLICDVASDFLGYDLLELCLSGPQEELNKTEYSQMAIFVLSYASVEQLKVQQPGAIKNCIATAGFSVGEITSLVFAGAISFTEALQLVKIRAEAMQKVCDAVPGGMMTVFYGPDSQLEYACLCAAQWCRERGIEDPVCKVANYLFPHCKVIAGNIEALKFIEQNATQFKLKRLKKLPVSGAFHTDLMKPAAVPFRNALKNIRILSPKIPVYSNVNGSRYRNSKHIFEQLPKQIYRPVKWEQTLHVLYARSQMEKFPYTYECGPGTSLKSCLKMVNAKAWNSCLNIPV